MRKYVFVFLASAFCLGYLYFLNSKLRIQAKNIPAIGSFLNPYSGFMASARTKADWRDQKLDLGGVGEDVHIIFDKELVPHIKGETLEDIYFAQGYVHALHRLWQMDFSYRAVAGRLSEVVGKAAVDYDYLQRAMGYDYAAEQRIGAWKNCPEIVELMTSYTDGVNAYIDQLKPRDYPLEYKLLGYAPEPWTMEKSAYVYIGMCADLANGDRDIEFSNVRAALGPEIFDFLYPDVYSKQRPIVPIEGPLRPMSEGRQLKYPLLEGTELGAVDRPLVRKGIGSNNWAIASSKTSTNGPILASDPHLALRLPSVWYQVQLSAPDFSAYGVSIPGLPSVVIGFNEHISWAMTNFGHDFRDWYEVDWADEEHASYFMNGQQEKIVERKQTIRVAGGRDTSYRIKYTSFGPVWEQGSKRGKGLRKDLAMDWLLFDGVKNCDLKFFIDINRATNYDDYLEATQYFLFPPQNIVFACRDGDIAIRCQGRVPIRDSKDGKFVQSMIHDAPMGEGAHIVHSDLPMLHNPTSGFVFSANQHSTSPNFPYYYSGMFEGFRSREIYDQLSVKGDWTVEEVMLLQQNVHNLRAADAKPIFLSCLDMAKMNEAQYGWIDRLEHWDDHYSANAEEPTFFEIWFRAAFQLTFDELGALRSSLSIAMPDDWRFVELLEMEPLHDIFDIQSTDVNETACEVIQNAFFEAWDSYEALEDERRSWADYKNVTLVHMAQIPALSLQGLQVGGSGETINATTDDFGPSWRMVVSLSQEGVSAYGIYPGGQDGDPSSPYYDNFVDSWASGKYNPLFFKRDWGTKDNEEFFSIRLLK